MGLRWAVSLTKTESLSHFESLFRRSLLCLPSDDVIKQARFHFRDDSLACIVGRLLIRCATVRMCGIPWDRVKVGRGDRGKPFLEECQLHFNVSHQGDLVVLAASRKRQIGVDVMRVNEDRGGSSALEHISRMQKLFTADELAWMRSQENDRDRWTAFYRVWCLKESVLKATGTGLVNDLTTIGFTIGEERHRPGSFLTSTLFSECGISQPNWLFEESFVDDEHCVAVAKIYPTDESMCVVRERSALRARSFELLTLEQLLEESTVVSIPEDGDGADEFNQYISKPWKDTR